MDAQQESDAKVVAAVSSQHVDSGTKVSVHRSRPNFAKMFAELGASIADTGRDVVHVVPVYVCGPTSMSKDVMRAATAQDGVTCASSPRFDVHSEPFEW